LSESRFNCKKNTKFDQKTVSLLCVKTKSGAHKQLTFYFQMWKYFCRHLHSSLISMIDPNKECPRLRLFLKKWCLILWSVDGIKKKNFERKVAIKNFPGGALPLQSWHENVTTPLMIRRPTLISAIPVITHDFLCGWWLYSLH